MSKVFLSYHHSDQDFVETLHRWLIRDGVEVFFDKESIAGGDNWVTEIERGLEEADQVVLVLTPEFCRSEWTKLERSSAVVSDPLGVRRKLRPLTLKHCRVPDFLKPIQTIDVTTSSRFEEAYPAICRELGGTPRSVEAPVDRSVAPPLARLPELHRMPYRSLGERFVGRVDDLWAVHELLMRGQTALVQGVGVVFGTGGLGKTQLAIEYVHRFAALYPGGVFWVDAERGLRAAIDQVAEAAEVELDLRLKDDERKEQLWKALGQRRPQLMVLDDFTEEGSRLEAWLPTASVISVLVTTRRRDLTEHDSLSLDFLKEKAALELLSSGSRTFSLAEVRPLIDILAGLPLALELSRKHLDLNPQLSIEGLMEKMELTGELEALEQFAAKYEDDLPSGHITPVAATFQLSWEQASEEAQRVLQAMSLLAPQPVPRRLLARILDSPADGSGSESFDEAVNELALKLSLLELDQESDPWMHRLVRGFVRTALEEGSELFESVVEGVAGELARVQDDRDTASFRELEKVLPHGEELVSADFTDVEKVIKICDSLGAHHQKWGSRPVKWCKKELAVILGDQVMG